MKFDLNLYLFSVMNSDMEIAANPLEAIRRGDRKVLKSLYTTHRDQFVAWASKHYGTNEDLAIEVYQSAFTSFYYNVREGKISELNSKLSTYLFAIGKNQLRDRYKKEARYGDPLEDFSDYEQIDHSITKKYEDSHLKGKIERLLQQIGEPCVTVLRLFYFKHYSMEAIAQHMNYKSEQIAAKRKFICLKQLRAMI